MDPRVAIQGDEGSACEMAAQHLLSERAGRFELVYSVTARAAMSALRSADAEFGVFALESPVGTNVAETVQALSDAPDVLIVVSCCLPVEHVVMAKVPIPPLRVRKVVSHPVPLVKHADFLRRHFQYAVHVPVDDTGSACRELADGRYGEQAVVIGMPSAANLFGLVVLCKELPGNKDYLTKFGLIRIDANRGR